MKGSTHLAAGLAAALLAPEVTLATTAGLAIGSVLPDIDKETSLIGRYIPVIPRLLKHRSITHGLLFAAALFPVSKAMSIGCLIHLFLDFMNPEGIPLFWPMKKRFRFPVINHITHSGGFIDGILGSVLWAIVIYGYVQVSLGNPLVWPV